MKILTTAFASLLIMVLVPGCRKEPVDGKLDEDVRSAIRFHEGMLDSMKPPKGISDIAIKNTHKAQLAVARDVLKDGNPVEKLTVAIAELERKIGTSQELIKHKDDLESRVVVDVPVMQEDIETSKKRLAELKKMRDRLRKS
jgi:hypothetical protein